MTTLSFTILLLSTTLLSVGKSTWNGLSMSFDLSHQTDGDIAVPPSGGFARLCAQDLLFLQLEKTHDTVTFATKTFSLWSGSLAKDPIGIFLIDRLERAEQDHLSGTWKPLSEADFGSAYEKICRDVEYGEICAPLPREIVRTHRLLLRTAASHVFSDNENISSPTEAILLMFLALYNNGWVASPSPAHSLPDRGIKSYTITASVHSSRLLNDLRQWLSVKSLDEQRAWFSSSLHDLHI